MQISVIVPVYNVETYLPACVDSILSSTYSDFEVILVDDGSSDRSGMICDEAAARDERVKVLHIENGGVANARNHGMKAARGEYVTFVDADDVISPVMLQLLMDALMANEGCDFSMGRADSFTDDVEPSLCRVAGEVAIERYTQRQYMSYLFRGNQFGYPVVWCKLFRREFIGNEEFKCIPAEDIEWLTRLCVGMTETVVVEEKLYGYRVSQGSLTHENGGMNETIVKRLDTFLMCLNELPLECGEYRSWCLLYTYKMMLNTRYRSRNTVYAPEVNHRVKSIYSQTKEEMKRSGLKWPVKSALCGFYHLPSVYAVIYSIYAKLYEKVLSKRAA